MPVTAKMSFVPCAPSSFWFTDPRLHSVWLLTSRQMGLDAFLCTILLYNLVNSSRNVYLIDFYLIMNIWTGVTKAHQ